MTVGLLVEPPRQPDEGAFGEWNAGFAEVLLRFGAERFGWVKPVETPWTVVLCDRCWCGSPRFRPCWYCGGEGAA